MMADPAPAFIWGAGGTRLTPEEIAAQRQIANALLAKGGDYSPVQSPWQGAARVAQAILGGIEGGQADAASKQNASDSDAIIQALLGGGAAGGSTALTAASPVADLAPSAPASTGPTPQPMAPSVSGKIYSNDESSPLDPPDAQARDMAIRTVYGEDPGQSALAVANVIRNRAINGGFGGDTVPGVVLAKNQFEPWNNAAARARMQALDPNSPTYQRLGGIVDQAFAGGNDPTNGATMFYSPTAQAALGRNVPTWAQGPGQDIGEHRFYGGASPAQVAAAQGDPAALPQNASSAVGELPPGVSMPAGPATPVDTGAAPVQVAQASPQTAVSDAAVSTPVQAAMTPAVAARPAINPAIVKALTNPYISPQARTIAAAMFSKALDSDKVKTVDLGGSIGIMDGHGNILRTIAKGEPVKGTSFGITGEDQFGSKTYGFINPQTQTVTPVQGQPNQNGAAIDPSLADVHGEDFLTQLQNTNPAVASQVRAIVEGRAPYPTGMLLKTPYGQKLAQFVTQADPSFESGNPAARTKMQADAATGKLAQNNNALNTAIGHLGELSDAAAALGNGNYPKLNWAKNIFSTETGGTAVTNFNTIRDKVAEEFTRVYRGSGGSESDIKREIDNLNAANSPDQLHQAIAHMADLAQSKIDANSEQYKTVMGPLAKPRPMVSKKTAKTLDLLRQRAGGQAAPVTKTINGKKYIQQNGQWFEQ